VDGLLAIATNRTALHPEITNVELFAWFAHCSNFTGHPGPKEDARHISICDFGFVAQV